MTMEMEENAKSSKKNVATSATEHNGDILPKQEWPIGHLPDQNVLLEKDEDLPEKTEDKTLDNENNNGFTDQSVSWP